MPVDRAQAPGAPGEHEGLRGVTFDSAGHRLVGTLYLARGAAPKPTVLLVHGCPGLEKNLDLAAALRDRGRNALVFRYRGCWGSEGPYDLRTIPGDVTAAVDHLQSGEYPTVDPGAARRGGPQRGRLGRHPRRRRRLAAGRGRRLRVTGGPRRPPSHPEQVDREMTRLLTVTPREFERQRADVAGRPGPPDVVAKIAPRPLPIAHGSDDAWVPVEHARRLRSGAAGACRYVEMDGADHSFAWHRAELRDLVTGWLGEVFAWEER